MPQKYLRFLIFVASGNQCFTDIRAQRLSSCGARVQVRRRLVMHRAGTPHAQRDRGRRGSGGSLKAVGDDSPHLSPFPPVSLSYPACVSQSIQRQKAIRPVIRPPSKKKIVAVASSSLSLLRFQKQRAEHKARATVRPISLSVIATPPTSHRGGD